MNNSFLPPFSLLDSLTGLIPYILENSIERSNPDVFVTVADVADVRMYGFPHRVASIGSGAGLNHKKALGAALGEGMERYAMGIIHPEDLIFGSYEYLSQNGYDPISPDTWALFHPEQYGQIPFDIFTENTQIAWVLAESLTFQAERLVPACLVYMPYNYHFIEQGEKYISSSCSTGAACAKSRAESLLKGICEVVERDAFMIMWRNRLTCPHVQIDSKSSLYDIFQEKFNRPGLEYTLINTTLDLSIPSFFGVLIDSRNDPPNILVAGAAHPNAEEAALKTLLELAQGLAWKDHIGYQPLKIENGFLNVRSFDDRARLYAFNHEMQEALDFIWNNPANIPLSTIPSIDFKNVSQNLHHCIKLLADQELEIVALDLTPVDVHQCGFYVTKVLIPGCEIMEGDYVAQFLGKKRWRDVPYLLGLLPAIPEFDSLNPYPHPYP